MSAVKEPDDHKRVTPQSEQTNFQPVDAKGRITQDWTKFQQKLLTDSRKPIKGRLDIFHRLALEGMPSADDAAVADSYMDQHRHAGVDRPIAEDPADAEDVETFFNEFTPPPVDLAAEQPTCPKCERVVPGTWTTFLICPVCGPQAIIGPDGEPKKRGSYVPEEDKEAIELVRHASMEDVLEAARQMGEDVAWQRPLGNMARVEDQSPPESEDVEILATLAQEAQDTSAWSRLDNMAAPDDDDEAPSDSGVDPDGGTQET